MKFNTREHRWLSVILATFGIFLVISGILMNSRIKPMVQTKFTISVEKRKVAETQAKSNEIKVKDIEIEINNPISIDVKDYLENIEDLDEETLKYLKLDTSLVNINEAGTYDYKIIYKKKTYIGKVKVKEKELPNMTFTLKTIKIETKGTLSESPRSYINETITDEIFNNITLDISNVDTANQGDYIYYIIYKGVTYQGNVEVRDPKPTVITPTEKDKEKETELVCPENTNVENNTCVCKDKEKTYNAEKKTCE